MNSHFILLLAFLSTTMTKPLPYDAANLRTFPPTEFTSTDSDDMNSIFIDSTTSETELGASDPVCVKTSQQYQRRSEIADSTNTLYDEEALKRGVCPPTGNSNPSGDSTTTPGNPPETQPQSVPKLEIDYLPAEKSDHKSCCFPQPVQVIKVTVGRRLSLLYNYGVCHDCTSPIHFANPIPARHYHFIKLTPHTLQMSKASQSVQAKTISSIVGKSMYVFHPHPPLLHNTIRIFLRFLTVWNYLQRYGTIREGSNY